MPHGTQVFISGLDSRNTQRQLKHLLDECGAQTFFFASAYVSRDGVRRLKSVFEEVGIQDCAAIFGLNGYVTEPAAIDDAKDLGWTLRLAGNRGPQFHPKIGLVGSNSPAPYLKNSTAGYIGSANFTGGGLSNNIEVGLTTENSEIVDQLSGTAVELWEICTPVESVDLDQYSEQYAEIKRRQPEDHQSVGLGEPLPTQENTNPADLQSNPPNKPTFNPKHAKAAWAGLQSFTGDYTFQVEFPKTAGEVIYELVGGPDEDVKVYCSDGETRLMKYDFYEDNGMFRLNIPNDVPGVQRARAEQQGIALVEEDSKSGARIKLEIVNDEKEATQFIRRAMKEGSWGKTSTRFYGWF